MDQQKDNLKLFWQSITHVPTASTDTHHLQPVLTEAGLSRSLTISGLQHDK